MNKIDFINWLLNRYNIADISFENELNKYNNGLYDSIDFKLLQEHIEKHCKSLPTINELNRIVRNNNYIEKIYPKCSALQHIFEINQIEHIEMDKFPVDLKIKINKMCEKLGMPKRFEGV